MELGVTAVMLPELDFDEQIDLCQSLGVKYYQYRPRFIPDDRRSEPYSPWGNHKFDLTLERLAAEGAELTKRLRDAGMEPWGTVPRLCVADDDERIMLALEGAAKADAKCVRCGPPAYPREPFDYSEMLDSVVERYGYVIERFSGPIGLKLLIETHSHSFATSPALAWNICRNFDPERIGVIFDMPNFAQEGEIVPHLAVSVLRDYIDCLHVGGTRRVISTVDQLGCKVPEGQFCSLEESDLHVPTWLKALADAGLDPPLIIEDFAPNMTGAARLERSALTLKRILATTRKGA